MTDTIPEKRPRVTAREKAIRRMFSKETARDKMAETRTYVVEPRICKFTKEEDEQIVNAIRASIISMKKYGQGQKPRMVDMKHYDNTPAFLLPEYQGEMHEVRFSRVTSKNIIFVCASEFGVTVSGMLSEQKFRFVTDARQMAMYVMCHNLGMSRNDAALEFERNRATCNNSLQRISDLLRLRGSEMSKHYERIIKALLEYEK